MIFTLGKFFVIDSNDERVQKQGLRIAIIGESGSGKSWTIAVLSEQAKQQGVQVVFVDPHGEYHTFARTFEDLLVVGGENADLPLVEEAIDVYAEAYRMGKSLDFNLREIFTDEIQYGRIVEKILRALWKVQVNDPRPAIWNLEESHLECPQEKSHDAMRRVGLVKAIATGGRKFGVILVLGTQRPAELHKTPLSQCWIRLFGKLTDKLDREAVADYMKPINPRELMTLPTGKFYVFGWFNEPTMVNIRSDRLTEHGAETILIKPIERKTASETASISQLRKMLEERLKKIRDEESELSKARQEIQRLKSTIIEKDEKIRSLDTALTVASKLTVDTSDSAQVKILKTEVQRLTEELEKRPGVSEETTILTKRLEVMSGELDEAKGRIEELEEELEVFHNLKEAWEAAFPRPTPQFPVETPTSLPFPSSPKTCRGLIEKMWSEGWFSQPHALHDVDEEMRRRGFHYDRTATSHALLDLVKSGTLSREGKSRDYRYIQKKPLYLNI